MDEYVFGYGSLAAPAPDAYVTELRDAVRVWGVAMDNRRDLPGYKYYVLAGTEERPRVCVAFLDLADRPGGAVNGVCRKVGAETLAWLDRRERNYARVDVSDRVGLARGRVWAYAGLAESRERLRAARGEGRAVIARGYHDAVLRGFEALGDVELARFRGSTEATDGLPLLALDRIELP
jgi:cation transport regulator ChaC